MQLPVIRLNSDSFSILLRQLTARFIVASIVVIALTTNLSSQSLQLDGCEDQEFSLTPDCTALVTLINTATADTSCAQGLISWLILVDLNSDGTDDYEFSSTLPPFDSNLGNDTNGNGIVDSHIPPTFSGDSVEVVLPEIANTLGVHTVSWTVSDSCGGSHTCTSNFDAVDTSPPTVYLVSSIGLIFNPETNSSVLFAKNSDSGSFDGCTSQDNLRFTFTDTPPALDTAYVDSLQFSTRSIHISEFPPQVPFTPHFLPVDIYVWDEDDNFAKGTVNCFIVQTPGIIDLLIAGQVRTINGIPVPNTDITVASPLAEFPKHVTTDLDGTFIVSVPFNNTYSLSAENKATQIQDGVDMLDIIRIQSHILGLEPFTSPYQHLAADFNVNGTLTAQDLVGFRDVILGLVDSLVDDRQWLMIDASIPVGDLLDSGDSLRHKTVDVGSQSDSTLCSFVGVKKGDVDSSVELVLVDSVPILQDTLTLTYVDRAVTTGETFVVDFTSSNYEDMYGLQFTLEHPDLMLEEATSGALEVEGSIGLFEQNTTFAVGDVFTNSTEADEVLFALEFTAVADGKLSDLLGLTSSVTKAVAYRKTNSVIADAQHMAISMGARQITATDEIATTAQRHSVENHPNPASDETTIFFELPSTQKVNILVLTTQGTLLLEDKVQGEIGSNTYTVDLGAGYTSGVYLYTVHCKEYQVTKHLTIIN